MRMFDPAIFTKGFLPNGWPVCPNCGQDELVPEGSACNLICENCDWKEVMATMQTDHEKQIEALKADLYRVEAERNAWRKIAEGRKALLICYRLGHAGHAKADQALDLIENGESELRALLENPADGGEISR